MYRHNPQTKRLVELVEGGAIGRLRLVRCGVQLLALRRGQRPPQRRARGRRADGRRLLLRLGLAAARRRAGVGLRRAGGRDLRRGRALHGNAALPGRRPRAVRLRARPARARRAGGDRRRRARSSSTTPGTAGRRCSSCAGTTAPSGSSSSRSTRTGSQLENLSDAVRGRAEPLLGRDDALGQARVIEALYRSADEGRPVSLTS